MLDAPGLEGDFIGGGAKEQALNYAKQRQQLNNRPILIFDSKGILTETIVAKADKCSENSELRRPSRAGSIREQAVPPALVLEELDRGEPSTPETFASSQPDIPPPV